MEIHNEHVIKGKKNIGTFLFSRTFIFVLMVLSQLALILLLSYNMTVSKTVNQVLVVLQCILVIYIVNEKSDPTMKLIWVIFIMFVPALGTLMYVYVRIQPGAFFLRRKIERIDLKSERYLSMNKEVYQELKKEDRQVAALSRYIYKNNGMPVYKNTKVTYLPSGEDKYEMLIRQLEEAEEFIFMEYFIIEEGKFWNTILNILERKVQEGVEVRVMYDGLCSLTKLEIGYFKKLRKKGIISKPFAPARPFFTTQQNNRDHRKILVIDGKIAFTGGINLADEYMNIGSKFGYWKDSAVMLEGEAAQSFTLMFLQMWNVSEKSIGNYDKYINRNYESQEVDGYVIGYGDDPFSDEHIGESVYLHMINTATKYVHIVSPYLVLDNVMITALILAAKRGVDIKLVLPGIPDKAYAFCVARTYYDELIEAGIEIYEFTPGFTHAKMFICDDEKATVGTINLDYRSLFLHFENGCFIYKNDVILEMEKDYQEMVKKSRRISLIECRNRPILYKICGKVLRLVAPLM
ncbi:MAG: cardiolipin synthase [Eubacterium sp.]|nr:cardiolipin synthase [Eubacterium sp.]